MNEVLRKNRRISESYVQPIDNPKVPLRIKKIIINNKIKTFIDLGCGDGVLIHALKKEFPSLKITGIDISPRRISSLQKKFPQDNFLCEDVCNTSLQEKFDFVHSSQVIEHVKDDKDLIKEMKRLLSDEGILLVSSVIKRPWGWYKYKNNGKRVLDPTHEREYKNHHDFLKRFKDDFSLISYATWPVYRNIKKIQLKVPGYSIIEAIYKKRI